jgi:hypothetical protein
MVIYRNIRSNLVTIFPRFYDLKQIIQKMRTNKQMDNPIAYIFLLFGYLMMAHRKGNKTHAYSTQRSGSKKYAKVERRKRNKPKA